MTAAAAPRLRHEGALTVFLIAISALGMIGVDVFLPALPAISADLGIGDGDVQFMFSSYFLGVALSQIACGALSDRYGRRPILCGALVLVGVGALISAGAVGFGSMMIGRFVQGIGCGVAIVIWRSIAFDVLTPDAAFRVISNVVPAIVLSPTLAPIVGGGVLLGSGWRAIFLLLAVLAFAVLAVTLHAFAETTTVDATHAFSHQLVTSYRTLLKSSLFLSISTLICVSYSAYFAYIAQSSIIFSDLEFGPGTVAFLYVPIAFGFMLGSRIGRRLSTGLRIGRLLMVGTAFFVVGGTIVIAFCLEPSAGRTPILIAGFTLIVVGNGITLTAGPATLMAGFPALRGASSALIGLLQSLSTSASTIVLAISTAQVGPPKSLALMFFFFLPASTVAVVAVDWIGGRSRAGETS